MSLSRTLGSFVIIFNKKQKTETELSAYFLINLVDFFLNKLIFVIPSASSILYFFTGMLKGKWQF